MKVRLNNAPIKAVTNSEVATELMGGIDQTLMKDDFYYKVTQNRIRRFAREMARRIDNALETYFDELAERILVQGKGGQSLAMNKKYEMVVKYKPLSDRHFKAKQRMVKGGTRKKSLKNNSAFLQANPLLAGRNSFYAFSGRTHSRLKNSNTRTSFGKTTYSFAKAAFRKAKLADKQDGRRDFFGQDVRTAAFANLTFTIAPKIPQALEDQLYQRGPDKLGFHLFQGSERESTIMAGGRSGHIRRLASPVFAYYLRVKVPAAVNAFLSRRAQTIFYTG